MFEEWQAELHGHQVVYRMAGSGPAVVLIHGMINSSRHWRAVAERLAADHTVIAPDLIGHGDSATPRGDYSIGAHATAIRDLLSAIAECSPDACVLLSYSCRGLLSLEQLQSLAGERFELAFTRQVDHAYSTQGKGVLGGVTELLLGLRPGGRASAPR